MDDVKALEVLRLLADGIDPSTGEVLPAGSVLQQPDTVRALLAACIALGRSPPEPDGGYRAGELWTRDEDRRLILAFDRGVGLPRLAQSHGRTVGAIRARLLRFGRSAAPF